MTDAVNIIKKDGIKVENIRAGVQKTRIFIDAGDFSVERGDIVEFKEGNDKEVYEVVDPDFHEAFAGLPANYQMIVRKI